MKVFDIAVGISNASDKKDTTFASIVFSTGTSILPKWINENIETRNSEFVLPLARFILNGRTISAQRVIVPYVRIIKLINHFHNILQIMI